MLFKTPKEFFDTAESVRRITRDEELDLAKRMREGDDASAKDELITAYLPVLASYIRRYSREPSEEFIRRAVETLTDAVSGFDFRVENPTFVNFLRGRMRSLVTELIADGVV